MTQLDTMLLDRRELALVMPVYNEQGCIAAVLNAWRDMLCAGGIDFVIVVIDDGSRDRTASILDGFACDQRVRVIHQANAGHGSAILRGYRQAVVLAQWVFQCDSDNEMRPESFADLWELRGQADAVFGCRQHRRQNIQRKLVSLCSYLTARLLFGPGVEDVNTPYRLIRSDALAPVLECIAAQTVAPNVIVSGAMAILGARIQNVPVPCWPRQTGQGSLAQWKLWKAAIRSFSQTLRCSRRIRRLRLPVRDVTQVPCRASSPERQS